MLTKIKYILLFIPGVIIVTILGLFASLMVFLGEMAENCDLNDRNSSNRISFAPSSINDPKATQTNWSPLRDNNFDTHKLVAVNSNRLEFRSSIGAKLFDMIYLLVGGPVIVISFFTLLSGEFGSAIWILFIGLSFASSGVFLLYQSTTPTVFDKKNGFFWKGRENPSEVFDKSTLKYFTELEEIHALQLIFSPSTSSSCDGDDGYELNLVLKNGKRINVVEHGDLNRLRNDATTLSNFLEKPVWDAI
ncbi:hypothetical protein QUF74_02535 [Candidatus Halobeggiatoa sp. HSG11]|nr:hypothetical protein [Candidatus Halobeggiatoa sp. HSG11]